MGLKVENNPNKPDVIELKNIDQIYPTKDSEVIVIKGLNLLVEREPQPDGTKHGKCICILGPSGCGKCFVDDTEIEIRNKTTKVIEKISIKEFIKHFPQP